MVFREGAYLIVAVGLVGALVFVLIEEEDVEEGGTACHEDDERPDGE